MAALKTPNWLKHNIRAMSDSVSNLFRGGPTSDITRKVLKPRFFSSTPYDEDVTVKWENEAGPGFEVYEDASDMVGMEPATQDAPRQVPTGLSERPGMEEDRLTAAINQMTGGNGELEQRTVNKQFRGNLKRKLSSETPKGTGKIQDLKHHPK